MLQTIQGFHTNEKKFDPKKLQKLNNPQRLVEESYRILKPGGEIFIVDWKKIDMDEGPPEKIRCAPEQVKEELKKSGFRGVYIYDELPKHFLVVGKKEQKCS